MALGAIRRGFEYARVSRTSLYQQPYISTHSPDGVCNWAIKLPHYEWSQCRCRHCRCCHRRAEGCGEGCSRDGEAFPCLLDAWLDERFFARHGSVGGADRPAWHRSERSQSRRSGGSRKRNCRAYSAGDRGPIILIGHSLGADAVMMMAQSLDRVGIPVALVVPFDGTDSFAAPKNVACVLNITQRTFAYMHSGAGFHGELTNVNVSGEPGIDHFTIDKSPQLQALVMKSVLQAASAQSCRPGVDAPLPHAAAPLRRRGFEGLAY
jgi:hypothetical protein